MKLTDIISIRQVKIFLLAFVPVLLMTILTQLGITPQELISPQAEIRHEKNIPNLKPKLESKKSSFQLKKTPAIFPEVQASEDFEDASAYGVVDLTSGEVLLEKNFSEKMPIASLTKVMTAVVALDLANLNDVFTVSKRASNQVPSKVMLNTGEKISLEELLKASLISSANDSAEVIKEGIDEIYNSHVFLNSMNEKAKILGLKNSHFTNPQGFDNPKHYSSVEDLVILSEYALTYPFIKEVVSLEVADLSQAKDERFYLRNWNGLLGVYPGVYGLKIGNTDKAGHTTIVISEREGKKILVVVLGAPGVKERDLWAAGLLDAGFSKLNITPVGITEDFLLAKYESWRNF